MCKAIFLKVADAANLASKGQFLQDQYKTIEYTGCYVTGVILGAGVKMYRVMAAMLGCDKIKHCVIEVWFYFKARGTWKFPKTVLEDSIKT